MLQFNRPRSVANISSCLRAGDGAEAAAAAAALKFQQFDRRLRRMMIALIMSLGSGFGGADAAAAGGGFATHVECLVQRDRRRSAAGYKLDAAHCRLRQRRRRQLRVPTATDSGSTVILVLLMRKSFRFVGAAIKTSVKSKYCGKLRKVFLQLLKADFT